MEEMLWKTWQSDHKEEALWRLVEHYRDFTYDVAKYMYSQLYFTGMELDDIKQVAILGLVEAVKGYNQNMGASFGHYARFRIRGAILNSLPKNNEQQSIQAYYRRLEYERNKSLKSDKKVKNITDLANLVINLSYTYLLDDLGSYDEQAKPESPYERHHIQELREKLRHAINLLPLQEKQVIEAHYQRYQPFEAIAEDMQLSKGRISQIHKKAIQSLREQLKKQYQSYL